MDWLLDASPWTENLRIVFNASNGFMAASQIVSSICVLILWVFRRSEVKHPIILLTLLFFFASAGLSRSVRIYAFENDLYRLVTVVDFLSALASIALLIVLPSVTIIALNMPSPETFGKIVEEKKQLECEKLVLETAATASHETAQELVREVETLKEVKDRLENSTPISEIIAEIKEKVVHDAETRRRNGGSDS